MGTMRMAVEAAVDRFATTRLTAERPAPHHLPALLAMNADQLTMAPLGGTRSASETAAYLQQSVEHWVAHGFGIFMLTLSGEGSFAGRAGLRHVELGGAPEVELAYALMQPLWGRGLATEIGRALLELAFGTLALRTVVATARPGNLASRRVMEKLGFAYERELDKAGKPSVLYRATRAS